MRKRLSISHGARAKAWCPIIQAEVSLSPSLAFSVSHSDSHLTPARHSMALLKRAALLAAHQGLRLVHFSAQRKRLVWERGCI